MKTVKLSRKEYRERFGDTGAFCMRLKGTEPTIYFPGRASTKERLHEIYHATMSPTLEEIERGKVWETSDEKALEEVRASKFAAESIGKRGLHPNQLAGVALDLIKDGYKPNTILNSIVRALKKEGYEVDDALKSYLWDFIREEYYARRARGGK